MSERIGGPDGGHLVDCRNEVANCDRCQSLLLPASPAVGMVLTRLAWRHVVATLEARTIPPVPDHPGFAFSRTLEDAFCDWGATGGYLLLHGDGYLVGECDDLIVQYGLRTQKQLDALEPSFSEVEIPKGERWWTS